MASIFILFSPDFERPSAFPEVQDAASWRCNEKQFFIVTRIPTRIDLLCRHTVLLGERYSWDFHQDPFVDKQPSSINPKRRDLSIENAK